MVLGEASLISGFAGSLVGKDAIAVRVRVAAGSYPPGAGRPRGADAVRTWLPTSTANCSVPAVRLRIREQRNLIQYRTQSAGIIVCSVKVPAQ